ncbi:MAG: calcium-binding protein, partial [Pseudomonadota bacterium]
MPTITLTAGDDTTILTGVSNDGLVDTIYGLGGNDTILGDEGQRLPNGQINLITVEDDLIYGGGGADSLSGSFGANTIFGGDGED